MKKGIVLGKLFLAKGYDLIIIEDGEVPLAASPAHANYYLVTLCVLAALALIIGFTLWFMQRKKYVKRLNELFEKHGTKEKVPVTIKALKEMIAREESDIAASMV